MSLSAMTCRARYLCVAQVALIAKEVELLADGHEGRCQRAAAASSGDGREARKVGLRDTAGVKVRPAEHLVDGLVERRLDRGVPVGDLVVLRIDGELGDALLIASLHEVAREVCSLDGLDV